jgi:transcriptional regulator with XRE-family HTH domain
MRDYLPVSEQLSILFEVRLHPDGRPYTLHEVSEQINISLATLSQMRTGRIKNPQLSTLREICDFFKIPLRYFQTSKREECYALLAETAEDALPAINEIAFRSINLSPEAQLDVLRIIKWVQAAEQQRAQGNGLPPMPHLEDYDDEQDEGNGHHQGDQ